jgi:hypothetical protein
MRVCFNMVWTFYSVFEGLGRIMFNPFFLQTLLLLTRVGEITFKYPWCNRMND